MRNRPDVIYGKSRCTVSQTAEMGNLFCKNECPPAASLLSGRFNPAGYIRAWNSLRSIPVTERIDNITGACAAYGLIELAKINGTDPMLWL